MSKFLIYGLADPRTGDVRYIGRSSSGLRRPKHHTFRTVVRDDPTHKANWLRLLLADGLKPEIRVLEEFADKDSLADAECFWIAQARGVGWPLTNLTIGGDGGLTGMKHSEETKAKIGARHRGKTISASAIAATRAALLGRKHTPEARAKMSAIRAGRPLSAKHIAAAAAGQVGHTVSPETRAKISAANRAGWARRSEEDKQHRLARLRAGLALKRLTHG